MIYTLDPTLCEPRLVACLESLKAGECVTVIASGAWTDSNGNLFRTCPMSSTPAGAGFRFPDEPALGLVCELHAKYSGATPDHVERWCYRGPRSWAPKFAISSLEVHACINHDKDSRSNVAKGAIRLKTKRAARGGARSIGKWINSPLVVALVATVGAGLIATVWQSCDKSREIAVAIEQHRLEWRRQLVTDLASSFDKESSAWMNYWDITMAEAYYERQAGKNGVKAALSDPNQWDEKRLKRAALVLADEEKKRYDATRPTSGVISLQAVLYQIPAAFQGKDVSETTETLEKECAAMEAMFSMTNRASSMNQIRNATTLADAERRRDEEVERFRVHFENAKGIRNKLLQQIGDAMSGQTATGGPTTTVQTPPARSSA